VKPKPPPERKVAPADLKRDVAPTASARNERKSAGGASTSTPSERSGGASSSRSAAKAEAAYLAALRRAISRHQRYPDDARRRRRTGVVTLSFVVQGDGRIRQVRVTKSSGDASLDEAAMQALQRLNRFKPIPANIGRSEWPMRVPIRFDLK
jgi:protein TonB